MFFLNSVNPWRRGVQIYNVIVFSAAVYDLCTNPEAKLSEISMDLLTHAVTYLSLKENTEALLDVSVAGLNFVRIGAIYAGVTSGCSSIPSVINAIDVASHLLNVGTLILTPDEQLNGASVKETPAALKNN